MSFYLEDEEKEKVIEYVDRWTDNEGWNSNTYSESADAIQEYERSGGFIQLYPEGDNGNLIEGVVCRGESSITFDRDHEYLTDIEVDDPKIEDDVLKKVEIPYDYEIEEINNMLSNVNEMFSGTDYSLSEITI